MKRESKFVGSFVIAGVFLFSAAIREHQAAANSPQQAPQQAPQQTPQMTPQERRERIAEIIADAVAQTHNIESWRQKTALQFDLTFELNGQSPISGTLTYEISRRRIRFDQKDAGTILIDGDNIWTSSAQAGLDPERVRTLAYLATAPFRLRERGLQPTGYRILSLAGVRLDQFELQVKPPAELKQTVRVYAQPRAHTLHAVAGIPLGTDNAKLHAAVFDDLQTIEGVQIAQRWTIYNFTTDAQGDPIGKAALSNVKFLIPADGTFDKPAQTN